MTSPHDEQLAAYLAGELDSAARRAVETALARDPGLRRRVAALRRVDDGLDSLPPVEPPGGFDQRLRAMVADELDQLLGAAPDGELARRLSAHTRPAWLPRLAGVAAIVAVVGTAALVGTRLLGDGGENVAGGSAAVPEMASQATVGDIAAAGPLVVIGDRSLTDGDLAALVDDPRVAELAARRLDAAAAERTSSAYLSRLSVAEAGGAGGTSEGRSELRAPGAEAPGADGDQGAAGTPAGLHVQVEAPDGVDAQAALDDVSRCLQILLDAAPTAIPAYAELAERDGEAVIVYGLVTQDPSGGEFSRVEVWAVSRAACEVRYFTQSG